MSVDLESPAPRRRTRIQQDEAMGGAPAVMRPEEGKR